MPHSPVARARESNTTHQELNRPTADFFCKKTNGCIAMKKNIKELIEYAVWCSAAIGIVFHVNSRFAPKSAPDAQLQKAQVEQLDSAQVDTVQNAQKMWVVSENIKSR